MFAFACPRCRTPLTAIHAAEMHCPVDGLSFMCIDGIWRCLPPQRAAYFAQFVREYEIVRRAEGRGSDDPAYYRALPFASPSHGHAAGWQIRAQSFAALIEKVVQPSEMKTAAALKIIDLGAGSGWLSYQLARRGHEVAAVDLLVNGRDGLGVHTMYDVGFVPIQAEFNHLPLHDRQANLVIFNAALHYATDYACTLQEAWRVTAPGGMVVIMDTAVYHNPASGAQMVQERERLFREMVGFPSNALPSENYLTYDRLAALGRQLAVAWRLHWPVPAWRRRVRRLRAWLGGRREPAQFPLIVGRRRDETDGA